MKNWIELALNFVFQNTLKYGKYCFKLLLHKSLFETAVEKQGCFLFEFLHFYTFHSK